MPRAKPTCGRLRGPARVLSIWLGLCVALVFTAGWVNPASCAAAGAATKLPEGLETAIGLPLTEAGRGAVDRVWQSFRRDLAAVDRSLMTKVWQITTLLAEDFEKISKAAQPPDPIGLKLIHGVEVKMGRFLTDIETARLLAAVNEAKDQRKKLAQAFAAKTAATIHGLAPEHMEQLRAALLAFAGAPGASGQADPDGKLVAGMVAAVDKNTGRLTIKPPGRDTRPVVLVVSSSTKLRVMGRRGALAEIKPPMWAAARYDLATTEVLSLDVKAPLRKMPETKTPSPAPPKPKQAPRNAPVR